MTYNGAGQLTNVVSSGGTTTTHAYAGTDQSEIVDQTVSGTDYAYTYGPADSNGLPVVQGFTKSGSQYYLDHDNTGVPLALHVPSGNSNFYVLDALGTPMGMISQSGTVAATYTYDPAGTNLSTTGAGQAATVSPVGYASGFNGRTTGLTKFGRRWDDTTTNAFTSTDPITGLLNPDNANQYAYAASSPIHYVDSNGRGFFAVFAGAVTDLGVQTSCTATVILAAPETAGLSFGAEYGCYLAGTAAGGYIGTRASSNGY